ncbi:MAG: hypothetical protein JRN15_13040 [Nitrososphaerota archaeon]|nr:hypothetical protein [Nitrososphaerota archaeon]
MLHNRYFRLVAIDLGILSFCTGLASLGYGVWISTYSVQMTEAGVNLSSYFLIVGIFGLIGIALLTVGVRMISNARREYHKIVTRF